MTDFERAKRAAIAKIVELYEGYINRKAIVSKIVKFLVKCGFENELANEAAEYAFDLFSYTYAT